MKMSRNTQYIASFMIGVGSVLNISPVFANVGDVGTPQNDLNNLKKDWQSVGSYLYKAMEIVDNGRTNTYRNKK